VISAGLSALLLAGIVSVLVIENNVVGAMFIGILCGAGIATMVYVSRHLAKGL